MAEGEDDLWKALGFVGALLLGAKAMHLMLTDRCTCGGRRPKDPSQECSSCGRTYSARGPYNS